MFDFTGGGQDGGGKTAGAFSYELHLDVGRGNPIVVGLASDMDGKADLDALYILLLDYSARAQALKASHDAFPTEGQRAN